MRSILRLLFLTVLLLTAASWAWTQTAKRFAVLPFVVHGPDEYAYLGQGIQSMLTSRLKWTGKFEDLDNAQIAQSGATPPSSMEEAQATLGKMDVDYLIYGSVTILGEQASLDMHLVDREGQDIPQAAQVPLNDLIPTLENIAKEVNAEVFGRPQAPVATSPKPAGPAHPDLIYNEYGPERSQYHLNPEILYAGAADSPGRWRSQALPFPSLGMVVGDADGNGTKEIFILTDNKIMAYHVVENRLMPVTEYVAPTRFQCLNINMIDLDRDGYQEIIVSAIMENTARSFVLNFIDGKFSVMEDRIPYYLNITHIPPEYSPVLIGQRKGRQKPFEGEVHEMMRISGKIEPGRVVSLPKGANVFNFTYLPQEDNDYKIIVADSNDKLQIFSSQQSFQAVTDDSYAGSALGLELDVSLPGIEQDPDGDYLDYYYIPSRLVPVNLSRDNKRWDLLVNRNISVSAQFFARYRYFPQGEIHALFWDGINLNLNWKTRRIRGTVVDYGLADVMNDGRTQLYVLVNTHPGVTGFTQRRTILLTYALDLETLEEDGATVDIGLE